LSLECSIKPVELAGLFHEHRSNQETHLGVKKSGKGRRKLGRKKRRMRAKIRHRK
jgi:hypothetical protein